MKFKYILIFCCSIICEKTINAAYEIIFEKIETAFGENDRAFAFEGLRVKKYNRTTYVLSGRYMTKLAAGDDVDMDFKAYNFQAGQYKKLFEKRIDKLCKSLFDEANRSPYQKFYEASSQKVPFGTCPYPILNNTVTDLLINSNGAIPPYIPGGEKWRIDVRFIKDNEILGGYNLYGLLRNEESLMKGG